MSDQDEQENACGESSAATVGFAMENRCDLSEACPPSSSSSSSSASSASASPQKLTKKEMKKLKKVLLLKNRKEKRRAKRQREAKRRAEMRERAEDIVPDRKSLKKNKMENSSCHQKVVVDCSFDDCMSEIDTTSLAHQIQECYAANRRADKPLQLYVCGISGRIKKRLDRQGDYRRWDIHKEERTYTEVFRKEEIVYLTSDSPNVLEHLDEGKVYVIGGLVDHNRYKSKCYDRAQKQGLAHAQLPIDQYLHLNRGTVLTVNHVFGILLRFVQTSDWQSSMLAMIPHRKGVMCLREHQDGADPGQSEESHPPQVTNDESNIAEALGSEDDCKNPETGS